MIAVSARCVPISDGLCVKRSESNATYVLIADDDNGSLVYAPRARRASTAAVHAVRVEPWGWWMSVIVIRLHPEKPTDGDSFKDYLTDLEITVADRSFTNPKGTEPTATVLGTAKYIAEGAPAATIIQHFTFPAIPPPTFVRQPVATAAIAVTDPFPFKEYDKPDLRLTITRGTGANKQTILYQDIDFNVDLTPGALPASNPIAYAGLSKIALYLPLPKPLVGLGSGVAYLDIPSDGTPPPFQVVFDQVKLVLQKDPAPSGAAALETVMRSLTEEQCRHIAMEIASNRTLDPLPTPKKSLEELYSGSAEQERREFEADLKTYYTVRNTRADVLAKFIFSMSAALACTQRTTDATQVGFTLPILPGLAPAGTKIAKTTIVVSQ